MDPALRHASFPRDEAPIRHLHGGFQPSFDVEKHPRTVRVFADRTHPSSVHRRLDTPIPNSPSARCGPSQG
jgi:hypothetical protein